MAPSSSIRRILAWALALCMVIAACTLASSYFLRTMSQETERIAARFATGVQNVLNITPKITIDRTLVVQEHAPALELVSSKQQIKHTMEWSSTWLKSTKQIAVHGSLTASVGFDLKEPFTAEFDTTSRTVLIRHPRPRLLAVEVSDLRSNEDSGWWNSVNDTDRSQVLSLFTSDARTKLEGNAALLNGAREHLRAQLQTLLAKSNVQIVFEEFDGNSGAPAITSATPSAPIAENIIPKEQIATPEPIAP